MSKKTKIWLIVATSLVFAGGVIFACVMSMVSWDFHKLSTENFKTNETVILDNFSDISINSDTADITLELTDDDECKVACFEDINYKHSAVVEDNTLKLNKVDERKWFEYIGLNFSSPKITLYLPKSQYNSLVINESTGDVTVPENFRFKDADITLSTGQVNFYADVEKFAKIKASTGKLTVENVKAGALDLAITTGKILASNIETDGDFGVKVSTGDATLTDIKCKNLNSKGSTGDITLINVIATENYDIKRSTGDVEFDNCDATDIIVKTSTGSVKGTLQSEKVFVIKTDTGSVDIPKTSSGGKCEITTDTGNIRIDVI